MVLVTIRQLRPLHWSKNLLVFVPTLLNWNFLNLSEVGILFGGLCLIASAGYQINDLIDIKEDQTHPTKKFRPYAAGQISRKTLLYILLALLLAAVSISIFYSSLRGPLVGYGLGTLCYSLLIKKIPVFDVFWLSSLMTSRLFMGGLVVGIPITLYLSGFSFFLFLFLVLQKRLSQAIRARGDRTVFSLYLPDRTQILRRSATFAGVLSILSLFFYILSDQGHRTFSQPLWLLIFLAGLSYWMYGLCRLGPEGPIDDAISYLFRDKNSFVFLALGLFSFLMAKF